MATNAADEFIARGRQNFGTVEGDNGRRERVELGARLWNQEARSEARPPRRIRREETDENGGQRRGKRKIAVRRRDGSKNYSIKRNVRGARTRTAAQGRDSFRRWRNKYFDHRGDKVQVVWKFTVFDFAAAEVAEHRRKYSWRGKDMKDANREHADEARKKSVIESVELSLNGIFLVEKPQPLPNWIFSRDGAVLKIPMALAKT